MIKNSLQLHHSILEQLFSSWYPCTFSLSDIQIVILSACNISVVFNTRQCIQWGQRHYINILHDIGSIWSSKLHRCISYTSLVYIFFWVVIISVFRWESENVYKWQNNFFNDIETVTAMEGVGLGVKETVKEWKGLTVTEPVQERGCVCAISDRQADITAAWQLLSPVRPCRSIKMTAALQHPVRWQEQTTALLALCLLHNAHSYLICLAWHPTHG